MAKTNYTKVEAALDAAFLDRRAKELAFLADFYHRPSKGAEYLRQRKERLERMALLKELRYNLERIYRQEKAAYKTSEVKRKDVDDWIAKIDDLSDQQWEEIENKANKILGYTNGLLLSPQPDKDNTLILEEKKKQKNKRFNVRDGWLPLK